MANATYAVAIQDAKPKYTHIVKADGLPFDFEKEAHFALQVVSASDQLKACVPHTIRDSVINCAAVGLSLNPAQKHCYLIPWKGRCSLFVSYMGMEYMALAAETIQWIRADEVFSEDVFQMWNDEQGFHYKHQPKYGKRGTLIGAYAAWKFANGDVAGEFMDAEELRKVHEASKAPTSPAWRLWKGQMHCKAVIKRASKHWRKTPLLARQIDTVHALDRDSYGAETKPDDAIEGVSETLLSIEHLETLSSMIPNPKMKQVILDAYQIKELGDLKDSLFDEVVDRLTAYIEKQPKTRKRASVQQATGSKASP